MLPSHCCKLPLVTFMAVIVAPRMAEGITGGVLDFEAHPNVGTWVLTKYENPEFTIDLPNIVGTGTLVHPRVVLVAGHGTEFGNFELASGFYELADLKFSFGSDANDPTTWRDISALVTHPDYNPKVEPGGGAIPSVDIGAVILKEPVTDVQPAILAGDGLLDDLYASGALTTGSDRAPFTVVGYGYLLGDPVGILPPFSASTDGLRRVAQSEFMGLLDDWLFLDQKFARGNGGTQIGDSGGPAFWVDPATGEEILVGVTSRGDARGVAVSLYYRADIAPTLDFIASAIARVEAGEFDAARFVAQSAAINAVPEHTSFALCLIISAILGALGMRPQRLACAGARDALRRSTINEISYGNSRTSQV